MALNQRLAAERELLLYAIGSDHALFLATRPELALVAYLWLLLLQAINCAAGHSLRFNVQH
jgi:hypothetical protein